LRQDVWVAGIAEYRSAPDTAAAAWVAAGLRGFAESVLSMVPEGFQAYGRVFHPAWREAPERPVLWRDVARANGRVAHRAMQWPAIAGWAPQPGVWDREPEAGTLPQQLVPSLIAELSQHTSTPKRCWFAACEGSRTLPDSGAVSFEIPNRRLALLTGPITAARTSLGTDLTWQSPSLWWPDDKAWCVATEAGCMSTYVGGTRECIAAVVAHHALEAAAMAPSDGVTWASDELNEPPAW
jgi:hypothetical protein